MVGGHGRWWAVMGGGGRSWAVVGGCGRSWAVVGGRGRSWAVVVVGGGGGEVVSPTLGSATSKNLLLSSSRSWNATAQRVFGFASAVASSSPSSRRISVAIAAARGS